MEFAFFLLAIISVGMLVGGAIDRHNRKLCQIELKLDAVMQHLALDYSPYDDLPMEFLREVSLGNRVKAIKIFRTHFGVSLDEAKQFVDNYQANSVKS